MKLTEEQLKEKLLNSILRENHKKVSIPVSVDNEELPLKKCCKARHQESTNEFSASPRQIFENKLNDEVPCEDYCTGKYDDPNDEPVVESPCAVYVSDGEQEESAFSKLPESEQKEINYLVEKSKQLKQYLHPELHPTCWLDFETGATQTYRDEQLLQEWKEYKKRVQAFMDRHPKLPKMIVKAMLLDEYPEERPVDGRPWEIQEFEKITKEMFDTYVKKNSDYGNSFEELFNEYGMTSALLRIKDKYNRLKTLTKNQDIKVKDESIEDTLLDMANYAILTVIELRRKQ